MSFGKEHLKDPRDYVEYVDFDTGEISRVNSHEEAIVAGIGTALRIYDIYSVVIEATRVTDMAIKRNIYGHVTAAVLNNPDDSLYLVINHVKLALAADDETLDLAVKLDRFYPKV